MLLAGADEHDNALGTHGHVARVRNDSVKADLESRWQFNAGQGFLDPLGVFSALGNRLHHRRAGLLERAKLFEIGVLGDGRRHAQGYRARQSECKSLDHCNLP